MRPLEYVVLITLIISFVTLANRKLRASRVLRWTAFLPLVASAVQFVVEGQRWQLYPAYALAVIFALVEGTRLAYPGRMRPARVIRIGTGILAVIVMIIAVALPALLPVFSFPKPTGPYAIGTMTYHWTDTSRPDIYSSKSSDKRQLMVQVWYPAKTTVSSARAPYVDNANAVSTGLTKGLGLPSFIFDDFKYVTTHAVPAAPIATDKPSYPVLLYLTGLTGFRQASMFQIENLVSHGYIVAGIDQPYTSAAVTFPNGQVVYGLSEDQALPAINQSLSPAKDAPTLNGHALPDGVIPYLAEDARFTLDQLTVLNTSSNSLAGHLDLRHAGIFGISLGGMTAAETCHEDSRFSACLMMDAAMPADVVASGLQQPGMWITRPASDMQLEDKEAGGWSPKDIHQTLSTMQAVYGQSKPGNGYYVSVKGMFHHNFFDVPYYSPVLSKTGSVGPIATQRGFDIVNAYTLGFFNQALVEQDSSLLSGSMHPYPEAALQQK